jgi:hypothetical protein
MSINNECKVLETKSTEPFGTQEKASVLNDRGSRAIWVGRRLASSKSREVRLGKKRIGVKNKDPLGRGDSKYISTKPESSPNEVWDQVKWLKEL